jgi:hypothetical protein
MLSRGRPVASVTDGTPVSLQSREPRLYSPARNVQQPNSPMLEPEAIYIEMLRLSAAALGPTKSNTFGGCRDPLGDVAIVRVVDAIDNKEERRLTSSSSTTASLVAIVSGRK